MLRPLFPEEFTEWDLSGLKRALRRDTFGHDEKDVGRWLSTFNMTMWRYEDGDVKFGMLIQTCIDPMQLVVCYIWGKNFKANAPAIYEELRKLARARGCKYVTATFRSWPMFKASPAKLAYVYGYLEA